MFNYPIPPPPPPVSNPLPWIPPPPPLASHDPMEAVCDWYLDFRSEDLEVLRTNFPNWDKRFSTRTDFVTEVRPETAWFRVRITGKPISIHYLVKDMFEVCRGVEVGYGAELPFPPFEFAPEAELGQPIPVYHAAWAEYLLGRNARK
jgi:hypothetical protein